MSTIKTLLEAPPTPGDRAAVVCPLGSQSSVRRPNVWERFYPRPYPWGGGEASGASKGKPAPFKAIPGAGSGEPDPGEPARIGFDKHDYPCHEEVIVKELPSAIDSLPTPEERATLGYPPADRAAADVYSRILSTLCKKGKGITAEDMEAAYRLALEIEKDVPDRATVQRWCARLNFNWKYLPHRRSLGPGEGQSMTERWNEAERAVKSP